MINIDIDRAISKMAHDIEFTILGYKNHDSSVNDMDTWCYYISISAKDSQSLIYISRLLDIMDIRFKSIIIIPITYKHCEFDCIQISNIFSSMQSSDEYNIDTISIRECENLKSGDFCVSVVREFREDPKCNIIMSYESLLSTLE